MMIAVMNAKDAIKDQAKAWMFEMLYHNRNLTVDDVFDALRALLGEAGTPGPAAAPSKSAAPKAAPKSGGKKVPTMRTVSGRAEFDQMVYDGVVALGGKGVKAKDVRDRIGGNPQQVRVSLNRLIAAGRLAFTGQASGTRYDSL